MAILFQEGVHGWTLVAEKVTGRTGEHMDINSAAAFTIFDEETGQGRYKKDGSLQLTMKGTVNLVLVENATGEEVMVCRVMSLIPRERPRLWSISWSHSGLSR